MNRPFRMKHGFYGVAILMLSSLSFGQTTLPQVDAEATVGALPYQSYHGGDLDSISLTTGSLALNFPLVSYPQRGRLHLSFNVMYNDVPQHFQLFQEPPNPCGRTDTPYLTWNSSPFDEPLPIDRGSVYVDWAQRATVSGVSVPTVYDAPGGCTPFNLSVTTEMGNWHVLTADGAKHVLGNLGTTSYTNSGGTPSIDSYTYTGPFESLDATGWSATGTFTTSNQATGTTPQQLFPQPTAIIGSDGNYYGMTSEADANGNAITGNSSGLTDSIGRQISFPPTRRSQANTDTSGCPPDPTNKSFAVLWQEVPGINGVT